jgi:hypothetical protein
MIYLSFKITYLKLINLYFLVEVDDQVHELFEEIRSGERKRNSKKRRRG